MSCRIALAAGAGLLAALLGTERRTGAAPAARPAPARRARPATQPASAPRTRPTPRLRRIVFSSNRAGAWRIWTVHEKGTGLKQLTRARPDEHDVDPAFSPDGRRVLFTSTRGGKTGLWVLPLGGPQPKRICDGDQGDWSPGGRRIVFRRGGRIVTRDLATGRERTLTPAGWTQCSGPAWSPDGRQVAFAARQGRRNALFLVAAGGGKPAKLYDKKGACEPQWSPDGTRIAYETETHVCTIGPDGTKNRLVTYYGGLQRWPRWSPDGTHVVFCQGPSTRGPWELYVVPAGGGPPRKLTSGGSDMYPDWK